MTQITDIKRRSVQDSGTIIPDPLIIGDFFMSMKVTCLLRQCGPMDFAETNF
jgi:hypothetical protein